jgi:hypothetical protein
MWDAIFTLELLTLRVDGERSLPAWGSFLPASKLIEFRLSHRSLVNLIGFRSHAAWRVRLVRAKRDLAPWPARRRCRCVDACVGVEIVWSGGDLHSFGVMCELGVESGEEGWGTE